MKSKPYNSEESMGPEPNYFLVNRNLLESDRWLSEPFTRGQAWVDMFGLAQHSDGHFRVRGIRIDVKRGQLAYSTVTLAKRWKWSRSKIKRFLNELEKEGNIVQQTDNRTTLITINKYNLWQGNRTADEQQTNSKRTHTKNVKKVKNIPNGIGNKPKGGYGNAKVNLILQAFRKNIGVSPADTYPRRVAHNISQMIEGFIRRNADFYKADKGRDLTFERVHEGIWKHYRTKDYLDRTEKLVTVKTRARVYLEEVERGWERGNKEGIKR